MSLGIASAQLASVHTRPNGAHAFFTRLSNYLQITAEERESIARLQTNVERFGRRQDLIREDHPHESVYILCDGIVSRYRVLPDGRRQVLNFGLPGDIVGFPGCLFTRATASVCCMTDVLAAPVPLEQIVALFARFPRLGAGLFWMMAREAAICAERLVAVGRRNADERIAYFFLELIAMQSETLQNGDRFSFPITQEIIADALGLSAPHVNRTLRKLRQRHLLILDGQEAEVQNARGLMMMASFDPAHWKMRPIRGL